MVVLVNTQNKTKEMTLLTRLAFIRSTWL
jgi:hypothetical protein